MLARPTDDAAFAPEPAGDAQARLWAEEAMAELARTVALLEKRAGELGRASRNQRFAAASRAACRPASMATSTLARC